MSIRQMITQRTFHKATGANILLIFMLILLFTSSLLLFIDLTNSSSKSTIVLPGFLSFKRIPYHQNHVVSFRILNAPNNSKGEPDSINNKSNINNTAIFLSNCSTIQLNQTLRPMSEHLFILTKLLPFGFMNPFFFNLYLNKSNNNKKKSNFMIQYLLINITRVNLNDRKIKLNNDTNFNVTNEKWNHEEKEKENKKIDLPMFWRPFNSIFKALKHKNESIRKKEYDLDTENTTETLNNTNTNINSNINTPINATTSALNSTSITNLLNNSETIDTIKNFNTVNTDGTTNTTNTTNTNNSYDVINETKDTNATNDINATNATNVTNVTKTTDIINSNATMNTTYANDINDIANNTNNTKNINSATNASTTSITNGAKEKLKKVIELFKRKVNNKDKNNNNNTIVDGKKTSV